MVLICDGFPYMGDCDLGLSHCGRGPEAGHPPLKWNCNQIISQKYHIILLTREHAGVAASPEEPPLVVEVGCSLPRPDGGFQDGGAVTPLPASRRILHLHTFHSHLHGPCWDRAYYLVFSNCDDIDIIPIYRVEKAFSFVESDYKCFHTFRIVTISLVLAKILYTYLYDILMCMDVTIEEL